MSTTSTSLNWPRCCDDPALQEALAGLGADLQARGVLLADDRRRLLALACAPLAFIDVLGLCRLASTFAAGRPDPTLVVAVGFVALICAGVLATVPRGTRLGLDLTRAAELPGGDRALASLANSRRGCDGGQPVPQ